MMGEDADRGSHHKTTEITGFLTGDHECGLLFPDEDAHEASAEDRSEDGVYLTDLIPEEARDGEYQYRITVEAEEVR